MHDTRKIDVMENIHDENDRIAAHVNEGLTARGVFAINLMGAPGAGKTTVIRRLIESLRDLAPCVIEGDIEGDIDARELRALGVDAFQINTFGACHLDAPLVHNAVGNMTLGDSRLLFIENVGNLVCPAEFSIGEHARLLVSSVTEGSDKPYKYPLAFERTDLVLLNKTDLLPHLDFDEDFFMKGLRALNREAPVIRVSGKSGEGFAEAAAWIRASLSPLNPRP
ncbi:MAG: hydrogenase nickel incorporation protein HypB [Clostridiales Family XIII bacterium]|jgi:hydrogenase nickel incorporation protein HypB|nr:hydrogenase nickel incorporation protein HypB [Clostridiales Family XIII bacterium]